MSKSDSEGADIPSIADMQRQVEELAAMVKPTQETIKAQYWNIMDRELLHERPSSEEKQTWIERQLRRDMLFQRLQELSDNLSKGTDPIS